MKNFKTICCLFAFLASVQLTAQNSFKVDVYGEGQPILLLPGFSSTANVYAEMIPTLAKNYQIHAFTFAGFGDVTPIQTQWLETIKKDLEAYIIKNELKNLTILGHSMGGTLGLWLASEDKNINKLILIDALPAMGALMFPDYDSDAIQYDSPYNKQLLSMSETDFEAMAHQMAKNMSIDPEGQKKIAVDMLKADRKTYVYGYTDLLKLDLRQKLSNIDIPVYILAANLPYGKEAAEKNYKNQYKNLKDYTLNFAENSMHFIMYDQPEWLNDQIKIALDTNE
ncbi:alpha/beta fold hydrolase [Zunongwangia atlantica]|uniref:Hydrolase, alpha/beta hydrolase fold family protein n=1 Tax=Zunongwangia atlantica 22II14-10F7 TaxID=1185767 RepID=A0A1Y1T8J5_9FLAO|nr:alpha/beta hydrolase [Zunongwangia atlantica]ORL47387.1 hydrolase, alpha/beta hydrolase fold family protein [Zunongwangia atlantica 22II14-10F7]